MILTDYNARPKIYGSNLVDRNKFKNTQNSFFVNQNKEELRNESPPYFLMSKTH